MISGLFRPDSSLAVCDTTKTVLKAGGGDFTSIQTAVNAAKAASPLNGNWCINIDSSTYNEAVTVQNITFAYTTHTLTIQSDPNLVSTRTTVNPPASSAAAFQILNSSVNILGININPTNSITYGIKISSAYATISSVNVTDPSGRITTSGIAILNGAGYNTVNLSTANVSAGSALYVNTSSNTFNQDYFASPNHPCIEFDSGSSYNTVKLSTAAGGGSAGSAGCLLFSGDSHDVVTQSYLLSATGDAVDIISNITDAAYNTVSQSTMTVLPPCNGNVIQWLTNGSSNTVTQSYLDSSQCGDAVHISNGVYNTISFSTIVGGSDGIDFLGGTAWNTLLQDFTLGTGPGNKALGVGQGSNFNSVIQSTISVTGGSEGLLIAQAFSNTISNCYIQGSTAVWVSGSTGTVLNSNTLVATDPNSGGIWLDNAGNINLTISSNTIKGGSQNAGIYIDRNNRGLVNLSTNTILSGSQYGIFVATQTAGTQVWVTSNTIVPTVTNARNTYGIYVNGLTTGATIQNNQIYYRSSGVAATAYGLYAQSAKGLNIHHNQFNEPGQITGGTFIAAYFTGTTNTMFKFNDLNVTGTSLGTGYLLQAANGSTGAQIRDNIFSSSMAVTGSSATITVDAASQSGFASDYNDFYSYNGANTAIWGATAYSLLSAWQGAPASQDANSIAANPLWFNTAAGSEDFHPQSQTGRYSPAGQTFVQDCFTSPTIDTGDPSEPFNLEPSPNGSRVNQGSYGDTAQASETFQIQPPASIGATALIGQITVSWTPPTIPPSCVSYVDHYELAYSSVSSAGPFSTPPGGNPISSNTFVFLHSGLQSKTTYFYQVVTADSGPDRSSPAQTFAVTPDSIAPAAVTNLAASQGQAVGQVNLSWTFPGDDNGTTTLPAGSQYAIQYTTNNVSVVWSTANAQVTISTSNVPVGSLQGAVLSGLSQTVTYYFRLWTNHSGPVWSASSNIASSFSKQSGPGVISISPADGSSCVAIGTSVTVSFNKTVQSGSFANAFTVTLVKDNLGASMNTAVGGTISPAVSTNTYTFTPSANLIKNGTYVLSVSTLALDMQNNPLAQSTSAQFVTAMDRTVLNTLTVPNLGVSITVPGGALSADGCLVTSTGTVSPNLSTANQKLVIDTGDPFRTPVLGSVVDLKIDDTLGNVQSGSFGSPVTISIPYVDANNDGIVDGTNPPIRANTLKIWWLDDTTAMWIPLPASSVDTVAKRVMTQTPHFTTFALIGTLDTNTDNSFAFPVPFKPSLGHTAITFTALPQSATIKIFTVSGKLIQRLDAPDASGKLVWNVKTLDGKDAASGVYIYLITSGSSKKIGKLVIVR